MNQFMDHDVFQALARLLYQFGIEPDTLRPGVPDLTAKQVDRACNLCISVTALAKPSGEDVFLDVTVALVIGPITQEAITKLAAEQLNDALLGNSLWIAYRRHLRLSPV